MAFWEWNHDSRIFIFHQIDFMPKMPVFYHFKIIIINTRYIIWHKYIIIISINNIIFWLYNSIIKKPRYRNNAFTSDKYFHLKSCFWCCVVLNLSEVINGPTGLASLPGLPLHLSPRHMAGLIFLWGGNWLMLCHSRFRSPGARGT